MPLKTTTVTIDGDPYTIQQASVFRVLQFKKAAEQQGENADMLPLILDLLKRTVIKSETDSTPRWSRDEDFEDIAFPQLIELQNEVIAFSSPKQEAVETETKN